jgi:CDP-paratose 2-epimerase
MKVLVTGGLGVAASAIVANYLQQGAQVLVVHTMEEERTKWIRRQLETAGYPGALLVAPLRVERAGDLATHVRAADLIVHAPSAVGADPVLDPDADWRARVDGTRTLLEALRKTQARAPTVLLSSTKPYRVPKEGPGMHGVDEEAPLEPVDTHAAAAAAESLLGLAYARRYGLRLTVLRASNIYGPGPCGGPRHGWLTWFCIAAAIGREFEVEGGGQQVRDALYASDLVRAVELAGECIERTRGEIFNIGGGERHTLPVIAAAKRLEEWTGARWHFGPARPAEVPAFWVNSFKFRQATGWQPVVEPTVGMSLVLDWAKPHRVELRGLYPEDG